LLLLCVNKTLTNGHRISTIQTDTQEGAPRITIRSFTIEASYCRYGEVWERVQQTKSKVLIQKQVTIWKSSKSFTSRPFIIAFAKLRKSEY